MLSLPLPLAVLSLSLLLVSSSADDEARRSLNSFSISITSMLPDVFSLIRLGCHKGESILIKIVKTINKYDSLDVHLMDECMSYLKRKI